MALTVAGKNLMLDALGTASAWASLHIVNGNEVSGGSPAYARKAITFAAADEGAMAPNGTLPVFDVPACTVAHIGLYSAETDGTQYALIPVDNKVFSAQGTYTVTAGNLDLNTP